MAFTLNDKPIYWGLGIGALLAALIVGATYMYVITPRTDKIKADETQIADLDKKIEQGRAAERKLPQFRAEVQRLQIELEKLRRILPSTRNTEEIIQKIKALVDQGDFDLIKLTFPKLSSPKSGDPYAEWPIQVSVTGRFHGLAILFNRLGNFSRIMNVEQINVKALPAQVEKTIAADFVAKTFVYVEPQAKAEGAKPAAKPGGAAKESAE
jgi:type IV pilus assembly protein PilO